MSQPTVSSALLQFLRQTYPDKLPRHPVSDSELGRLQGHQEIIDKLQQIHDKEVRGHVRSSKDLL